MGWLADIYGSKTKNWFYAQLPVENTPNEFETKLLSPNEEYINIRLKSMRIVNVRKGLNKFYATVHSHIEIPHISGKPVSFNFVTTPGNLEKLDATRIDHVININTRLLGPFPYRGANLKFEVGLFSVKEDNLAAPFINLLSAMSKLGGVSFVSAALPYVKPLEEGIALLTGSAADSTLEIGINMELDKIKTGYFVVMRADSNSINANSLRIEKNSYHLIDKNGKAIEDYPYMVFEISSIKNRPDFFEIPEVSVSYNKVQEQVRNGNYNEASAELNVFKRILYTSPDLFLHDAKLIYNKIETDIKSVLEAVRTAESKELSLKDLSEYKTIFEEEPVELFK